MLKGWDKAARHPDFIPKDKSRVLMAHWPHDVRLKRFPIFTIFGIPYVIPIFIGMGPPSHKPYPVPVYHRRKPYAMMPSCGGCLLFPMDSVFRAPNIVISDILGHIVAPTHHVDLIVENNRLMKGPWGPTRIRGGQFPIFPVGRKPNIVFKGFGTFGEKIIAYPSQYPYFILEYHYSTCSPWGPSRSFGFLNPGFTIVRRPNLIPGFMSLHSPIVPSAHHPHPMVKYNRHGQITVDPRSFLTDQFPVLSIRRFPDIPRRRLLGAKPSSKNPQMVPVHYFPLRVPCLPTRTIGLQDPVGFFLLGNG